MTGWGRWYTFHSRFWYIFAFPSTACYEMHYAKNIEDEAAADRFG